MKKTIIALSGKKQSGKSTSGEFIKLYFSNIVNPQLIKEYSFADPLKEFCIKVLGLTHHQVWGTDEDKNSFTNYKWEELPDILRWRFSDDLKEVEESFYISYNREMKIEEYYKYFYDKSKQINTDKYRTGHITAREILQVVGTDMMRFVFPDIWVASTFREIRQSNIILNIITDCRFVNEIESVLKEPNSYILRLMRNPNSVESEHISEKSLDGFNWNRDRCFVINNSEMSIKEKNNSIITILDQIVKNL